MRMVRGGLEASTGYLVLVLAMSISSGTFSTVWSVTSGSVSGACPSGIPTNQLTQLVSASGAQLGNEGYIFGGSYECLGKASNTVYSLDLTSGSIAVTQAYPPVADDTQNAGPPGVFGPTYRPESRNYPALWATELSLYMLGGSRAVYGFVEDFWSFNLTSRSWAFLMGNATLSNPGPVEPLQLGQYSTANYPGYRYLCGTAYNGTHLTVFAGQEYVMDVWVYWIRAQQWTEVFKEYADDCSISPPRAPCGSYAAFADSTSGAIWMFSGWQTNELWYWNPSLGNVTLLSGFRNVSKGGLVRGNYTGPTYMPMARQLASLRVFGNGLVMFGGSSESDLYYGENLNDLWTFSIDTNSWTLLSPIVPTVTTWTPGSVYFGPVSSTLAFTSSDSLFLASGDSQTAVIRIRFLCVQPGYFIDAVSYNCTPCAAGKVVAGLVDRSCVPCPAGQSTYGTGDTACHSCPIGSYSTSGIPCTACPTYATTLASGSPSVSLCYCTTNYYGAAYLNSACIACSTSGGIMCLLNSTVPLVNAGYARDPQNPSLALTCIPSSACLSTGASLVTPCSDGYMGSACGSCESGFFRQGLYCKSCPSPFLGFFLGVAIVVVVLAFIAVVTYCAKSWKLNPLLRISLTSLQLLGTFPLMTSSWPPALLSFLDALSFSNLNIDLFSPDCTLGNITFFGKAVFKVLLPLLAWLFVSILVAFSRSRRGKGTSFVQQLRLALGPVAVAMVLTFYTLAVQATFQPFQCLQQPNGRYTLYSDPATYCYEGVWLQYIPLYAVSMVLYLLVVPAALLLLFVRIAKDKSLQARYEFSMKDYRDGYAWWELVNTVRRALIVATISLVEGQAKYFLAMLFLLSFIILETMVAPYRDVRVSQYSMTWGFVCLLTQIAVGVIFQSSTVSDDQKSGLGIFVIVLIVLTSIFSLSMRVVKACVPSKQFEFWLDASSVVAMSSDGLALRMEVPAALAESKVVGIHMSVVCKQHVGDRIEVVPGEDTRL